MKKKYKILIVDDSDYNRFLLSDILGDTYDILEACDGVEAIKVLSRHNNEIYLVLLDIIMPKMDGFEVMEYIEKTGWLSQIPVVVISAESSSIFINKAFDLGATEFISRPFNESVVKKRVKNTIMLSAKYKSLENVVTNQIYQKERVNLMMVDLLNNVIEFRNGESSSHILNVRFLTESLLKSLISITDRYNLSSLDITMISNASAFHDIGKISIPEQVLNKRGKLTKDEFELIKTHTVSGYEILSKVPDKDIKSINVAKEICRWHHEKYDGKGYPDGLLGEEIPISAQVVSLADVCDSLTSERVYRPPYTPEKAFQMIINGECGQFNPLLIESLKRLMPFLNDKLKRRMVCPIDREDIYKISDELIKTGNGVNLTMRLLEEEREKAMFYSRLSKDVLFEYDCIIDTLAFSESGFAVFDLPEKIIEPSQAQCLRNLIDEDKWQSLVNMFNEPKKQAHNYSVVLKIKTKGVPKWYELIFRPLFDDIHSEKAVKIIGKIVDIDSVYTKFTEIYDSAITDDMTGLVNCESMKKIVNLCLSTISGIDYEMILIGKKVKNEVIGFEDDDLLNKVLIEKLKRFSNWDDVFAKTKDGLYIIFSRAINNIETSVLNFFHEMADVGYGDSIRIGVSVAPKDGSNYEELFESAKKTLMYTVKNSKSKYYFYDKFIDG